MSGSRVVLAVLAALTAALLSLLFAGGATAGYAWTVPQTIACCGMGGPWEAGSDDAGNSLVMTGAGAPAGLKLIARSGAGPWPEPVVVSSSRRHFAWADAQIAGSGAAAVVWVENRRRAYQRVRALVREPGGAATAPVWLSPRPGTGVRRTQISVDAAGNALAVWEADVYRSYDVGHLQAAYRPAGGDFGRPRRVSADGARFPAVALGPDGHGVIAWLRGTRVEAVGVRGGVFGELRQIGTTGSPSAGPNSFEPGELALAAGAGGSAVIAWAAVLATPDGRPVEDEDTRSRVVRVARRPPGGRFGPPADVRTISTRERLSLSSVDAAAGPAGRAIVAWQEDDYRSNSDNSRGLNSIYSRLHGVYARSGGGFGAPVALSPEQDGYVTDPALAFTADGTLVAAWGWYLDRARSGVQVAEGRGGLLGPATTLSQPLPSDGAVRELSPRVSVDARGTAIVFWRQQQAPLFTEALQTATGSAIAG